MRIGPRAGSEARLAEWIDHALHLVDELAFRLLSGPSFPGAEALIEDIAPHLDAARLPLLADAAAARFARDADCETADAALTALARQAPETLLPHLPALFEIAQRRADAGGFLPWRPLA